MLQDYVHVKQVAYTNPLQISKRTKEVLIPVTLTAKGLCQYPLYDSGHFSKENNVKRNLSFSDTQAIYLQDFMWHFCFLWSNARQIYLILKSPDGFSWCPCLWVVHCFNWMPWASLAWNQFGLWSGLLLSVVLIEWLASAPSPWSDSNGL